MPSWLSSKRREPSAQKALSSGKGASSGPARSAYGKYCRTLKYAHEKMGESALIWQQAYENPLTEKWCVQEICERNPDENGNGGRNIEDIKDRQNIRYADAVGALADFASGQGGLGFAPVETEEEAQALGKLYFKNLARLDGIGFDNKGKPSLTLNGHVISEGQFTPDEISKLEQAQKEIESAGTNTAHDTALDILNQGLQHKEGVSGIAAYFSQAVENRTRQDMIEQAAVTMRKSLRKLEKLIHDSETGKIYIPETIAPDENRPSAPGYSSIHAENPPMLMYEFLESLEALLGRYKRKNNDTSKTAKKLPDPGPEITGRMEAISRTIVIFTHLTYLRDLYHTPTNANTRKQNKLDEYLNKLSKQISFLTDNRAEQERYLAYAKMTMLGSDPVKLPESLYRAMEEFEQIAGSFRALNTAEMKDKVGRLSSLAAPPEPEPEPFPEPAQHNTKPEGPPNFVVRLG